MNFLEKDLEQIIFESKKEVLQERGLYIYGKLKRQFKIGNYGIADLIEFRRPYYHPHMNCLLKGEITVYELKQDKIGVSAFLQALGYLKGIRSYLERRNLEERFNYRIILIGKTIELNSSISYLTQFLYSDVESQLTCDPVLNFEMKTYSYDIDGLHFESADHYKLINEGF